MTEKLPHEYTNDDYTLMQKTFYERETDIMSIENHGLHNDNPDYWNILLKPLTSGDWSDKLVLDFGCGCGRNVQNILNRFVVKEAHGCDISSNNVHHCEKITPTLTGGKTNTTTYLCIFDTKKYSCRYGTLSSFWWNDIFTDGIRNGASKRI
jgi:2-polyprenyl-3-methyl-5-hydroxy-6-metoxy-1,4-benzoquinol methylase